MEFAVFIIGAVAGYLAYHDDYEDGLFGRSSFAVIVLMAVIIVLGRILGYYHYELPLEIVCLLWAVAAFMMRHAWRFTRYRVAGQYSWNGADRRRGHRGRSGDAA